MRKMITKVQRLALLVNFLFIDKATSIDYDIQMLQLRPWLHIDINELKLIFETISSRDTMTKP